MAAVRSPVTPRRLARDTQQDDDGSGTARISVIIPAYNEERMLPRLLAGLDEAKRRYRAGADRVETIVADNGSSDATASIAESHGCVVVPVGPRIIGAVRNAGARAARGRVLAFVDADTQVHPETLNAIEDYFSTDRWIVGVSGAIPERRSLGITLSWLMLGLSAIVARYGIPRRFSECAATGVVCCRKADWAAVGGYSERWLMAEDVWLLLDLGRLGRRRGQRCGWLTGAPAVFSTRKFDVYGDWHYLTAPTRLALLALFHRPGADGWVRRYWYGEQREPPASRVR